MADFRLSYLRFIFGFYPPVTGTDLSKFGPAYAALSPNVLWKQYRWGLDGWYHHGG